MLRAAVLCALVLVALPGAALAGEAPPGAVLSDNLEYVTRVPGTGAIISANFDRVGGRDVMLASGDWGIKSFDVSDPRNPRELSTILPAGLNPNGLWENEDVDVDKARKLVIVSVDPRHSNVDQASCPDDPLARNNVSKTRLPGCKSGIYLVSYADPAHLTQAGGFIELPVGHTSTCIAGCRFVWTGGPARRDDQLALGPYEPGGRGDGRPIWVTDLRDAAHPRVFPDPIDLHRNDGATDYSHDVQVDDAGIAWVSGRGGVRGYATSGRYLDPDSREWRWAAPWAPVLVAGGGVAGTADPVMFMHNSLRPVGGRVRAAGVKPDNVLIGTEEQFNDDCETDGRIVFSDLTDSWGGAGAAASTPERPYRMPALSSWHPTDGAPDTTAATDDCSAHYFSLQDGVLASAWYSQGTRLLDVSDARNPAPDRVLPRAGHRPGHQPQLGRVGRALAPWLRLRDRQRARDRGPAPAARRPAPRGRDGDGAGAGGQARPVRARAGRQRPLHLPAVRGLRGDGRRARGRAVVSPCEPARLR
jgi:hypothetical protein